MLCLFSESDQLKLPQHYVVVPLLSHHCHCGVAFVIASSQFCCCCGVAFIVTLLQCHHHGFIIAIVVSPSCQSRFCCCHYGVTFVIALSWCHRHSRVVVVPSLSHHCSFVVAVTVSPSLLHCCGVTFIIASSRCHHCHFVVAVMVLLSPFCCHHRGVAFAVASSLFRCRLVVSLLQSHCCVVMCYAYGLLLTRTKSTYRLITILAVYKNGPGLSQDNPLCLLFILPCSLNASQRF